jgi:hypothetical protein
LDLFLSSDDDGGGYLDTEEFTWVLKRLGLELSDREMRDVVKACDIEDDGVIEYREFIPSMLDLIHVTWGSAPEKARDVPSDNDSVPSHPSLPPPSYIARMRVALGT